MNDLAARFMHAVSSTRTGGLPGPAQIARLPVCIAAFTTAGPPVTQSNRTASWSQIALNESSVGCSTMVMRFSMPTSRSIARLYSRTADAGHNFDDLQFLDLMVQAANLRLFQLQFPPLDRVGFRHRFDDLNDPGPGGHP